MILNQGDLTSTKICLSGRSCGSSSRRPAGASSHGVSPFASGSGEPQRRQKCVRYGGGDSRSGSANVSIKSPPCTSRKSARFTPIPATKAEPLAFRHRLQWHSSNGPTARVISNLTPPQRQLPRIIPLPLIGSAYSISAFGLSLQPSVRIHKAKSSPVEKRYVSAPAKATPVRNSTQRYRNHVVRNADSCATTSTR